MSLIGEERKQKILELLETNGNVTSADMVRLFQVSKETVRRYLDELEDQGKLKKVYGGAVKPSAGYEEPAYMERMSLQREEKSRIGRQAASLIHDGEVIFIDEGTTLLAVIPYLTHNNLTILTHSFPAASLLIEQQNQGRFDGRVLFLGGEISSLHARCEGSTTEAALDRYYFDKAFISVDGLHSEAGLTSMDDGKAAVSRKAILHAAEVIAAADHTKLGRRFPYKLGNLQDIDIIVCDQAAPEDWEHTLSTHPIHWVTAASSP